MKPSRIAALALASAALTACSSSSPPPPTVTVTRGPSSSSSVFVPTKGAQTFTKPPPVRLTSCKLAQRFLSGPVVDDFDSWHPNANEFNQVFAARLRQDSARLRQIVRRGSEGPEVAIALQSESLYFLDLAYAIKHHDDAGVNAASDKSNGGLADIRSACHF